MKSEFMAVQLVDLHNDTGFAKLASFAAEGALTEDELNVNLNALIENQAYAEDASYADDINRMFSIASPIETKISALYATKCASLLDDVTVNRINDACRIYGIDLEVPVVNKTASIFEDPAIMAAIDEFDREWIDVESEATPLDKYASATGYGTELDTCLAARAYYANEPEEVEAIQNLAKIASYIEPAEMVNILHEIDSALGIDTPHMQKAVGSPEYAVYEKVASENMVNLGSVTAPLSVISEYQDQIKDMGVSLDWDGESGDALQLQLEQLPSQIKSEIGSWVK
jgi:hypothetical protein